MTAEETAAEVISNHLAALTMTKQATRKLTNMIVQDLVEAGVLNPPTEPSDECPDCTNFYHDFTEGCSTCTPFKEWLEHFLSFNNIQIEDLQHA